MKLFLVTWKARNPETERKPFSEYIVAADFGGAEIVADIEEDPKKNMIIDSIQFIQEEVSIEKEDV